MMATGDDWRLSAWGRLFDNPSWDLATLARWPRISVRHAPHCERRPDRHAEDWEGVATRVVLGRLLPMPDAAFVMVHGAADYRAILPISRFAAADALFALSRNGRSLSDDPEGPVRLILPGRGHGDSVKGVHGLEFLAKYWPGSNEPD